MRYLYDTNHPEESCRHYKSVKLPSTERHGKDSPIWRNRPHSSNLLRNVYHTNSQRRVEFSNGSLTH